MKTLCYDPWIAAYILICLAFFIWLSIGAMWSSQGVMENGNCPENISTLTMNSAYFGFTFIFVGIFALFISSLLSMCFGRGKESTNFNQPNQQKTGTYSPPV